MTSHRFSFGPHARDALLVLLVTSLAFTMAQHPTGAAVGPLVLALLLGAMLASTRWARGIRLGERPATRYFARDALRIGIVLLGARLDVRVLFELGPLALAGSILGALVAFFAIELVGRITGMDAPLRRALAIGTAICGASAIAAALPLLRAKAEHASLAIATVSLVGTAGVLAFAAWHAAGMMPAPLLATIAGGTLQEVGHVVAAGQTLGPEASERALLVKLSRVILLAPALLALGWFARQSTRVDDAVHTPLVPRFVAGFLAVSALVSLGVVPAPLAHLLATAGVLTTASAMAAIGFGVDVRVLRTSGRAAVAIGTVGFLILLAAMTLFYAIAFL
ncbi:MAG: putative sulfate exporter family transporter [Trueperaceae bacterium]|nr:putative sulfate exporter family transporter [Trueperaceae bacterium]